MSDEATVARANGRATASMLLGLSSLVCLCFTGLPAIALGVMALPDVAPSHRLRAIIGITAGTLLSFLVVVFGALAPQPDVGRDAPAPTVSAGLATQPAAPTLPMPDDQAAFCAVVAEAREAYGAVDNDLKRSRVRGDRKRALAAVLGSGQVRGWVGHASELTTNREGKAVFSVALPCGATVGTWNNMLSDIGSHTLIEQASPLFEVLAELEVGGWGSKGSPVRFSGALLPGSGVDGFGEKSLTERGSMTEPAFVFRFSGVEPL